MRTSPKSALGSWPAIATLALMGIAASAVPNRLHAQNFEVTNLLPAPPLDAQFEYATLTATTNTINVTMLPVTRADGTVAYENLTIPFNVTQNSVLS